MVDRRNEVRRTLIRLARTLRRAHGEFGPDDFGTADGRRFAVGDRVIARAPDRRLHPPDDRVAVAPKTASGRRSAALDSTTVRALREHRRAPARQRMAIGNAWPDHDLVFVEADGRPIHPDHFTRTFHQRARRAELPAIRLHDLRHGWATLALQSGVHPKIVSQQLGHATVTITLDICSHVTPAMTSEAVGRVTAAVFASGGR